MKKSWLLPLICVLTAGCSTTSSGSTSTASSTQAAVKQGCDAFDECSTSGSAEADDTSFKTEYESLNGQTSDSGSTYRTVTIPSDNPMVTVTAEDVVSRIENGDTFYVYFGDALCPWCRSTIETAISEAQDAGIDEIDYVDIWDDEGNEVLRDEYELQDGEAAETYAGTDAYQTLLEDFDSLLDEYTLSDDDGNEVDVGEKRIYAPTYIYIENGKAVDLVTGISDQQEDAYGELTDAILQDEQEIFSGFFSR
jgi:hypothetical protein